MGDPSSRPSGSPVSTGSARGCRLGSVSHVSTPRSISPRTAALLSRSQSEDVPDLRDSADSSEAGALSRQQYQARQQELRDARELFQQEREQALWRLRTDLERFDLMPNSAQLPFDTDSPMSAHAGGLRRCIPRDPDDCGKQASFGDGAAVDKSPTANSEPSSPCKG